MRNPLNLLSAGLLTLTCLTVLACSPAIVRKGLRPHYRLLRPEGVGPFPALMLVPGSRGIESTRLRQAKEVKELGYVVIFVDYLSARGLGRRGRVTPREIAQDIRDSVTYLKAQSFVDGSRIGAIGWSRGGRSILTALEEAPIDRPPFQAAAVFYKGLNLTAI